jgi:hypothetical protein
MRLTPLRFAGCVSGLCAVLAYVLAIPAAGEPHFRGKPSRQLSLSFVVCFPHQSPENCGPSKPHGRKLESTPIPRRAKLAGKILLFVPPGHKAKMTCPGRCSGLLPQTSVKVVATATQDREIGQFQVDSISCDPQDNYPADEKSCLFHLDRQTTITVLFSSKSTVRRRN